MSIHEEPGLGQSAATCQAVTKMHCPSLDASTTIDSRPQVFYNLMGLLMDLISYCIKIKCCIAPEIAAILAFTLQTKQD